VLDCCYAQLFIRKYESSGGLLFAVCCYSSGKILAGFDEGQLLASHDLQSSSKGVNF
jgi:hypothetical protein